LQAYLTTEHPDYSILAARIAVSNLHKMTDKSFSAVMTSCYNKVDKSSGCAPCVLCPGAPCYPLTIANSAFHHRFFFPLTCTGPLPLSF
jgi:hypothetical protein